MDYLTLGYLKINPINTLDFYAKYSYTFQEGDSATITRINYNFDDINSHRLRVGVKNSYNYSEIPSPYIGISFEKEFDAEASYTVNGLIAGVPTLKGDTVILELGLKIEPSEKLPLSFNFGVEGYTGVQDGVSFKAQVNYLF